MPRDTIGAQLRAEAELADRPGQRERLIAIADRIDAVLLAAALMGPVIVAAQAYRHQEAGGGHLAAKHRALFAAVDTYEAKENTDG